MFWVTLHGIFLTNWCVTTSQSLRFLKLVFLGNLFFCNLLMIHHYVIHLRNCDFFLFVDTQVQSVSFGSNGCPPHSKFNPLEFSCDCWEGYEYNFKTFTCDSTVVVDLVELTRDWTKNETVQEKGVDLEDNLDGSSASPIGFNSYFIMFCIICWVAVP